jgi:hypothetical protein
LSTTIDTTQVPTGSWAIDATHSTVGFTIVYMGVAPFKGAFRSFEATLDENGLRGTAQASSVDVDNERNPIFPGSQLLQCGLWVPTIGEWCDNTQFTNTMYYAILGRGEAQVLY